MACAHRRRDLPLDATPPSRSPPRVGSSGGFLERLTEHDAVAKEVKQGQALAAREAEGSPIITCLTRSVVSPCWPMRYSIPSCPCVSRLSSLSVHLLQRKRRELVQHTTATPAWGSAKDLHTPTLAASRLSGASTGDLAVSRPPRRPVYFSHLGLACCHTPLTRLEGFHLAPSSVLSFVYGTYW
jgi:hypothetical protein